MNKEEREKLSNIIEEDYKNIISPDLENFIEEHYISKEEVRIYKNEAAEACIVLSKILSKKQLGDIKEDELRTTSLYLEGKRKQDEVNYVKSLLYRIEELENKIKNYISKEEVREKIEKQIKHYEELREEIRSMRESNRNETRIIDSEETEFTKALCGHYECLMCGNMVNGFNKYCPHCGRINKDY